MTKDCVKCENTGFVLVQYTIALADYDYCDCEHAKKESKRLRGKK